MKDDYNTNSHYLTYTFIFRKVGIMYFLNLGVNGLTISLPRVNNFKFLLQPHQKYNTTQYEELGFL